MRFLLTLKIPHGKRNMTQSKTGKK